MATPAWQARPPVPSGGSVQQSQVAGPQSHWGAPGTANSQVQGPRPPYGLPPGPPSLPPSNYGQSPTSMISYRGPAQMNSSSGGPLPPPPPIPPVQGSSSGMLQYVQSPPVQSLQSYGPSVGGSYATNNRWQPPVPGSTPTPTPLPQSAPGRGSSESSLRPPMPPPGPTPLGASQSGPPAVSAPLQPPPYQQYPANLGPAPQLMGPWMPPPQQPNPMQQRSPFSSYPNSFQAGYPNHLHPIQDIAGSGPAPPSVQYASADPSLSKGVSNSSSTPLWGNQTPFTLPPAFSIPSKDASFPLNGRHNSSEAVPEKPVIPSPGDNQGSGEVASKTLGGEAAEVSDAWTAHKTADGTIYYYNSIRGQSTYEKPPGFKGEADKVNAQPTPVSWERLNGTDWALVTTNDGKKYYYNTKSQATSWQVPAEVVVLKKKQVVEVEVKPSSEVVAAPGTTTEKSTVSFSLNIPAAATGGREAVGHKALVTNSALDLIKKKLQDPGAPNTSSPSPPVTGSSANIGAVIDTTSTKSESIKEKIKGNNFEAVSSDSSSDSEEEDPGPTKEERIVQFKDMLKEKGIAPFSKWEKELPKVIFDLRFKAIPSHTERRAIFEHYVRTRADEERKEKRAAQKAAVEGFKQLLEEATKEFSYHTTYESFARTWGKDCRFEALDRKEREALLNERILPLRKAEEDRVKAELAVAVAGFRELLVERGDITTTTRWSKVREALRSDPRYGNVRREEREGIFNAYVAELLAVEQEVERAAKAKRDEEEKLKEREREMRKRKEREEQEMERVRIKARRKDAVTAYQALLTEKIKDPEASWTEARPKLEKDALARATNPDLELAERERLFREHTNDIFERCVREYRLLLADVITIDAASKSEEGKQILTSWTEAKKLLKTDPRYSKMPRRDRESWWRRYADDVQRRMKVAGATTPKDNGTKAGASHEASRRSPGLKQRYAGRR